MTEQFLEGMKGHFVPQKLVQMVFVIVGEDKFNFRYSDTSHAGYNGTLARNSAVQLMTPLLEAEYLQLTHTMADDDLKHLPPGHLVLLDKHQHVDGRIE